METYWNIKHNTHTMKIAITGHRPNKLEGDYDLVSPLIVAIRAGIVETIIQSTNNPDNITLITGMALGIDTLFAKIAISMNIPFIAAIPCLQHDSKWPDKSRKIYHDIIFNPLCTVKLVSNTTYNNTVMQKRNEWMVDQLERNDILIAV